MTSYTWNSGNSGDWNTAANWDVGAVPNDGAAMVAIGASADVATISNAETFAIGGLTLSAGTLDVLGGLSASGFTQSGGILVVGTGQQFSLPGTATLGTGIGTVGGEIDGPGTLATGGQTTILASALGVPNYSIYSRAQLYLAGGLVWDNTGTVADAGVVFMGTPNGGTLASVINQAGGSFDLTADGGGVFNNEWNGGGPGVSTFLNAGVLAKTGGRPPVPFSRR